MHKDSGRHENALSYVFRQINIVNSGRVQIDGMKAFSRAVDNLQTRLILNGQIDQQWPVNQFAEALRIRNEKKHTTINAMARDRHFRSDLL